MGNCCDNVHFIVCTPFTVNSSVYMSSEKIILIWPIRGLILIFLVKIFHCWSCCMTSMFFTFNLSFKLIKYTIFIVSLCTVSALCVQPLIIIITIIYIYLYSVLLQSNLLWFHNYNTLIDRIYIILRKWMTIWLWS